MKPKQDESAGYSSRAKTIARHYPSVSRVLLRADHHRKERLTLLTSGPFAQGLEELLVKLGNYRKAFLQHSTLVPAAFVIARARNDFMAAIESLLSGCHSVVIDLMRSVMEAEYLFSDFVPSPSSIERWLKLSDQDRRREYSPAKLRERRAKRAGKLTSDMIDAGEYSLHSKGLHLSPSTLSFAPRGIYNSSNPFDFTTCLAEIFEHARRFLIATDDLLFRVKRTKSRRDRLRQTPAFFRAWEATQLQMEVYLRLTGPVDDYVIPKDGPIDVLRLLRSAEAKRIVKRVRSDISRQQTQQ
jgi:hypothetical protein